MNPINPLNRPPFDSEVRNKLKKFSTSSNKNVQSFSETTDALEAVTSKETHSLKSLERKNMPTESKKNDILENLPNETVDHAKEKVETITSNAPDIVKSLLEKEKIEHHTPQIKQNLTELNELIETSTPENKWHYLNLKAENKLSNALTSLEFDEALKDINTSLSIKTTDQGLYLKAVALMSHPNKPVLEEAYPILQNLIASNISANTHTKYSQTFDHLVHLIQTKAASDPFSVVDHLSIFKNVIPPKYFIDRIIQNFEKGDIPKQINNLISYPNFNEIKQFVTRTQNLTPQDQLINTIFNLAEAQKAKHSHNFPLALIFLADAANSLQQPRTELEINLLMLINKLKEDTENEQSETEKEEVKTVNTEINKILNRLKFLPKNIAYKDDYNAEITQPFDQYVLPKPIPPYQAVKRLLTLLNKHEEIQNLKTAVSKKILEGIIFNYEMSLEDYTSVKNSQYNAKNAKIPEQETFLLTIPSYYIKDQDLVANLKKIL